MVATPSWCHLRLRVFQFRALPFGLTSAPGVFTKVILPLGHQAHMRAISLLQYLDDWLIRSPDKLLLSQQTGWLLEVMRRAGFVLNEAKSHLTPTQRITHIGVEYHLYLGLMFPPMTRVQKFEHRILTLLKIPVTTAFFWLSLLGILSSATYAIPLGRLHLRPLQLYLLAHWRPASRNLKALIPVKHDLLDHHLRWWLDRMYTSRDAARHSRGSGTSVYRCVRVGMGRPPSHTPGEWCLVDEGDKTPHQSIGNDGCTKRLDGLQETVDRYDSATHVRQSYRRVIPAKTGRHSISVSLPSSTGSAVTSTRRTDYYSGQAYPGGEECIDGSSLARRQDHSHGMDPSPVCCECSVHHMGQTEHRPVRYTPEPPASGVRASHGRPTSSGCRRIINFMEGNVCLCIPPIRDAG